MSGRAPGRCCTWTSTAWRASRSPGTRVTGHRRKKEPKRAGVGYDYLHCVVDDHSRLAYVEAAPTRGRRDQRPHPRARPGLVRRAGPRGARGGDDRQRLRLHQVAALQGAARASTAPATSSPRPTRRAGTGRPSASSEPCRTSGHTRTLAATRPSACGPWDPSCATTTGDAPTARWETGRRSAAFTTSVGRTASRRQRAPLALAGRPRATTPEHPRAAPPRPKTLAQRPRRSGGVAARPDAGGRSAEQSDRERRTCGIYSKPAVRPFAVTV